MSLHTKRFFPFQSENVDCLRSSLSGAGVIKLQQGWSRVFSTGPLAARAVFLLLVSAENKSGRVYDLKNDANTKIGYKFPLI
jgi:hypothetical protein